MKKLAFAVLSLAMSAAAFSQVSKPVLTVEKFTGADASASQVEMFRNKVIAAAREAGRVEVVDVSNQAQLKAEMERRKSEMAMNDAGRVGEMTSLMSNNLLKGNIDRLTVTKSETKTKDGKVTISYSGDMSYTLTIVNPENGTTVAQKNFTGAGYGSTPELAAESALNIKMTPVKQFIANAFALGGKVIAIDEQAKGKAKTVYIDLGSADGVKKGDKMDVFKEVEIAGEKSNKLIGEIQVVEVMSAGRSLCKVGKGGEEIVTVLESGSNLPVKTKEQKSSFFGSFIEN